MERCMTAVRDRQRSKEYCFSRRGRTLIRALERSNDMALRPRYRSAFREYTGMDTMLRFYAA